jgi:PAS domain S-box-containing protein
MPDPAQEQAAVLRVVWDSPFPATLQGADGCFIDVNDAFASLLGRTRAWFIGRDELELQPAQDRESNLVARQEGAAAAALGTPPAPMRRRLVDVAGRERWFSIALSNLAPAGAPPLWLSLLQDVSTEVAAREQAQRAQDELSHWFELSGTGMLVYDHTGLIVRSNAAFEALVERVPEVLADAAPELQALLGWHGGGVDAALVAGAPPLRRHVALPLSGGRQRQLDARLSAFAADRGEPRVMAVVEDRSAEEERDLARLEMGMLMDTASIGVATYDPGRGWLAPTASPAAAPDAAAPGRASGALLGIGRELVESDSLPEYERLQRALRRGERTEVRYAVRHPELGARWLLTRVEPGALAGGRSTTSVVTLDITEQERAQRRNEQLLRELTTILDGSMAGIAYLRGPLLVRCNRRFERMLGFEPGGAAGATLAEALGPGAGVPEMLQHAGETLAQGRPFEAELPMTRADGRSVWYSLSVRRAEGAGRGDEAEAVAVLSDISRLKSQQAELEQLLRDRELMFSLSDVGIVYLRGSRIERANQAMAVLSGYAQTELTTLDAAELYENARECVAFEARVAQALQQQGRFSGERLLRRRDGSLLWVQVAVRPVNDENSDAGLICSFVDVDERRRARETLALQAERTRAILNSVLVGIVTVSENGIEWMNRSARRMFGGELADFVGEPISTVATPEPDHPLRRDDHLQRLQEGRAETFECRLRGRDGREFWVVGNAVLTGSGDGAGDDDGSGPWQGRQLTFALLDIERRRQAEVSIAQAQASLQRVIETAPLAIALFDARSLRVLQVNQTAATFFRMPMSAMLGHGPEACGGAAKAAALRQWLQAAAASGERATYEWRDDADPAADAAPALAGDGGGPAPDAAGLRVWDCRIAPLAAAGGVAAQLLLVATDVTEQRAAERARLQAAIEQRELLVREVHHRIKNNLQGVAGLLQQNAARHPEVAGVLTEAVGQVQAIAQVYGLQVGSSGPLALAPLLRAIAQSVQRSFGRAIDFEAGGAELPYLLPEAEAIPLALTVNELFSNAIKHGSGGGVRCSLLPRGDAVCIRIAARATLAEGFSLAGVPAGVSGLGLVRALLPRRSAQLLIEQRGDEVVAELELRPPSVKLPA